MANGLSKFPEALAKSRIGQIAALFVAITGLITALGYSANQILETYMKHHPTIEKMDKKVNDLELEREKQRELDIKTMQIIANQVNYNSVLICKLNNGAPHRTFPCDTLEFLPVPLNPNPNSPLFEVKGEAYPFEKNLSIKLK